MFGYLSEFWDSIAEVGSTSVAYFQSIGNAVAGAIGNLLSGTLHFLNDTWVFLGWIFHIISEIISLFIMPLNFVIELIRGFLISAFSDPSNFAFSWDNNVIEFFNYIPYWENAKEVVGICILILGLIFVLKQFTKL